MNKPYNEISHYSQRSLDHISQFERWMDSLHLTNEQKAVGLGMMMTAEWNGMEKCAAILYWDRNANPRAK